MKIRVFATLGIMALVGLGVFALMLSSWTTLQNSTQSEATSFVEELLAGMVDTRPYLEESEEGLIVPNRALESEAADPVHALSIMMWNPKGERWVRTDFPFWFIRLKMRHRLSAALLFATAKEDWGNLLLDVNAADLERRGPGLILHIKRPGGREILVWNMPAPENL